MPRHARYRLAGCPWHVIQRGVNRSLCFADDLDREHVGVAAAQIDGRARRYAVKLFLSHLHLVWHFVEFGTLPPKPYALGQLDHGHFEPPLHLDLIEGLPAAMRKAGLN